MNTSNEKLLKEIEEYVKEFKSVILGTISKSGKVDVTYAPHLLYEGENYIFISEVGDHYVNLKSNEQIFEIMFLEDESKAFAPTARKRVRYNVTAEFLPRDDRFNKIADVFEEHIGSTFKHIRNMQDFHLVKLNIKDGRYVKGFGQAFSIVEDTIEPLIREHKHK